MLAPGVERQNLGQGLGSSRDRVSAWTTPAVAATARPPRDRLGCFQAKASLTIGPLTRSPETWLLSTAWPPTLRFLLSLPQLALLPQKDLGSGLPKTLLLVRMCLSVIPEV